MISCCLLPLRLSSCFQLVARRSMNTSTCRGPISESEPKYGNMEILHSLTSCSVTYHFILQPFPWKDGDVSLFHNPHTNPRPDGEPAKVESDRYGPLLVILCHLPPFLPPSLAHLIPPSLPPSLPPSQVVSPSSTFTQKVGYLWIKHLHEDPVKRDEERWQHLEALQRRKEEQYPDIS